MGGAAPRESDSSGLPSARPSDGGRAASAHGRHRRRPTARQRWTTVLLVVSGLLTAALGVAIGAVTWTADDVGEEVGRLTDALPSGDRPPAAPDGALTFLIVAVDSSAEPAKGAVAESVMLVRVPADRATVQVVYLPPGLGGASGVGSHSTVEGLSAAGGTKQLVRTVESMAGVRVDHVGLLDFPGFESITDALGGVTVDVPAPYRNQGHDFPAARQRLDGAAALAYVRSSSAAARAVAGVRQQRMIEALFERVSEERRLSDLGRLTGTVQSFTRSLRVDDTLGTPDLVSLAWELRGAGSPEFVTAPTDDRAEALWEYLRTDSLRDHLDEFR
jgi:LCP family protein required for cell wall assembly